MPTGAYLIADGENSEIVTLRSLEGDMATLAAPLLRTHSRSRVLLPAQRYHTGPDGQLSAVMQAACTVAVYDEETGKLSTLVLEPGENRQAISV